jgi:hypothetical protein
MKTKIKVGSFCFGKNGFPKIKLEKMKLKIEEKKDD